ncbi:peptidase [Bacillus sp. FJAT-18017]|uniref:S9 family peptidase n=1 Tax=Bacillus sp. FJAT-18017 TaxID=1705566 RepID=UPI0006ADD398|nr:S9 family peptidase [Bacillus sp. FJAT-18017]ALC91924.1 peptidase [Bacillus sp. FJAT-18017]
MGFTGIKSEDLVELKSAVDPQLSPDGTLCAYTETGICSEKKEYYSNIFIVGTEGQAGPVQWTYGKHRNHSPRWSPDGTKLAFVSNRSGKNQLYIVNAAGGEARMLTDLENGAGRPVWSPDGTRIAFQVSVETGKKATDKQEEKKEKELEPLEVTKMKYKSDSSGFWKGDYSQIAVVDVETGEVSQLTDGKEDYHLHCWSPDGKTLAIGADLTEDKDQSFTLGLYLFNIETAELTQLETGEVSFWQASWSPDGRKLGLIGQGRTFQNATLARVWVYDLETKVFTCMTEGLDATASDTVAADFHQGAVSPGFIWADDNTSFYFIASDLGNTVVYYGNTEGELYPALLGDQHVYGLSVDSKNQRAAVAISKPHEPGDLFMLTITDGTLTRLTSVNESFLTGRTLSKAEPLTFEGSEGHFLNGWIMKPAGFEEGKKYPLVLEIHGGPHAMYGNSYMNEFQILSSRGYAVLYINPRGSHGYGQEHVNAVRGDYGGGDYQDVMAAVDYALETYDFIDENRLGVTGGSYGGFMTNWIVGQTNRFKAAVTQRSISNWVSFYGVSDIGYYFTEWQIGSGLEDIEKLWKHSPLAYVKNIETPLLILHSEKDYRCPIEQAEQLFIAMKRLGKDAKFVRFPESNHELSRSGKPNLRIARLNYIADWFDQYLK